MTTNNQSATTHRGRGRPPKNSQMHTASQTVQATEPKMVFDQTTEELYGDDFESRVPNNYKEIRSAILERTRNLAKDYIPKMYTVLKDAKFSPAEARDKILGDCGNIWKMRTILAFMPEEAKDTKKAEAGRRGGEATADRQTTKEERHVASTVHKAAQSIPSQLAVEEEKITFEVDVSKWADRIKHAVDRALETKSGKVRFEFDLAGNLMWVEDVIPKVKASTA